MIENTGDRGSIEALALLTMAAAYMGEDPADVIENQERRGQAQLVHSDQLPADMRDSRADFEALGFTFGDPDPRDDMFIPATLPEGWKREGSSHAMWSYIVDPQGRHRVSVFYKAAFYDRSAFMRLDTVRGYVVECAYEGKEIVTDDTWATPVAVAEAARAERDYAAEQVIFWRDHDNAEYVEKYKAERDKYAALADQYGGSQ